MAIEPILHYNKTMKKVLESLLSQIEYYTKTDVIYLIKGGSWLTLGRIVSALSGFILTIIFANLLTQHSYGDYKFILSISGIIAGLLLTGMGTAVVQAVSRGYEQALIFGFKIHLKWSVAMSAGAIALATYYHVKDNEMMAIALVIIAICMPIIQSATLYSSYLVGKKDFKTDTYFSILYAIVPTLSLIVSILFTKNALILASIYFISTAITSLSLYILTSRRIKVTEKIQEITERIKTISYAKHLSLMNFLATISYQLDKVLIYHHFGAAQLALYTIATAPPQQIRYLNKMLGTMVLPKLSSQRLSILRGTLHRKALILLVGAIILTSLYVLIAPFLFRIFFPNYTEAILYSQAFALVILFFPSTLYQQTFTAHMHKRKLYVIQTLIPSLKIILLFIFLPHYGIWAAIGSIICVEFIRLILVLYFFVRIPHSNTEPV